MPVANRVTLGFAIALACGTFVPAKADVMEELAPTGKTVCGDRSRAGALRALRDQG